MIILNSAWEMIDEMVNWATFVKNECTEPTNLQLTNRAFSRLPIIFLSDFLSEIKAHKNGIVPLGLSKPARNDAPPSDKTFLFHIRQVCTDPKPGDRFADNADSTDFEFPFFLTFVSGGMQLPAGTLPATLEINDR